MTQSAIEQVLQIVQRWYSRVGRALGIDGGYDGVRRFVCEAARRSEIHADIVRYIAVRVGFPAKVVEGNQVFVLLSTFGTLDAVRSLLSKQPEPSQALVEALNAQLRNLCFSWRERLLQAGKALPHRAGASKKLSEEDSSAIRARVATAKPGSKETLQQLIADREGVSLRTIQRICSPLR